MFQNILLLLLWKPCYLLMLVTASPINYDGSDERELLVGNLQTPKNSGSTASDVIKNYVNFDVTKYKRNLSNRDPPGESDKNDSPGETSTGYKRNPDIPIPDKLNGSPKELPCMSIQQRLESNVNIQFEGSSSIITQLDAVRIQNSFIETYNKLSTKNCDTLYRLVNSASVETIMSNDRDQVFSVNFNVEFNCRGCDIQTTSLFANSDRKLLTRSNWNQHIKKVRDRNYRIRHGKKWRDQHWVKSTTKRGKKMSVGGEESSWKVDLYLGGITDSDACVCEFQDAKFRSPSEEEFRSSYDESVSILITGIDHVGQVSEFEPLPTVQPSTPSPILSEKPSVQLWFAPSFGPSSLNAITLYPSIGPSESSRKPSKAPTHMPSNFPSYHPSLLPSDLPSSQPSGLPSNQPSSNDSTMPSIQPSGIPLSLPSGEPSESPSGDQSFPPSTKPSGAASFVPSEVPSSQPSRLPSIQPLMPSGNPTTTLSGQPSSVRSSLPSNEPSIVPSGQTFDLPTNPPVQSLFTQTPTKVQSEMCTQDSECTSNVCVDGICLEGKQANLDLCDDNNDCVSGRCYLQNFTENAEQVCCPENYVTIYADDIPWSNTPQYYCRYQQPTGHSCAHNDLCEGGVCVDGICLEGKQANLDLCDDNNDCVSGRCYLQNFTENAEQVCCPENYVTIYADDIPWSNTPQYYCRYQQPTGHSCAHNDLCEGGVCVDGICLEGKQANLDLCDDNNDCVSGRCYLQNFTENAEQVCCPENYVTIYADDIPWSNTPQYYCRYQQPTGHSCAHNDLCEGGVCVDGICLEGKQANLDLCDDNNDCVSGRCYLQNFTENAEQVCCPENYVTIYADDIPWSNTPQYYCRYQQPTGHSCAHNDLCEGGVCVDGICLEGKQANLDLCDDNNDCVSGRCYLQNFTENAEQVCCPENYVTIYADDIPWSNTPQYYCRYQQPTGHSCAHNDLCEGGVCVDGICLEGKQANLDLCDDNNDCVSGRCYSQNFTENAEQVCCPENYVTIYADDIPWSNTRQYYCRYQQPTGHSCAHNDLCEGGVCVDGICLEGKQANLDLCDDNNDCVSGQCYLQNFTENAEQVCCPENYITIYADDIPWSNALQYYCRYQQPSGASCANNELCAGAICQDNLCVD